MSASSPRVDPVLLMWKIERRFVDAEQTLNIIRGADLAIWPGQSVALIAPSGTGKSTLLHMAGLLEKPDAGEIYIGGTATSTLDDKARTSIRRETLGFVYQAHHLL
ncbi:MAG: ATP-binding cassette domain-containing protein, partial [Alphaproteobacteria bacterium]|nr:ATP-binding cassette domain-containing protein [Alphaproteobacteria bacterium]